MTKYYRVRTQEQWDWLKNKLEIEDDLHVSNFPVTILYDDVICGIYRYHDDPEPLIEVSQLMEDEKMENYVTIDIKDFDKIKDEDGQEAEILESEILIPTSLLYPKVKMTETEEKEFDELKKEVDYASEALSTARITDFGESDLARKIYRKHELSELEFARAWVDPSLIEVIPEKRWNVKVPPFSRTNQYYYKYGEKLDWSISSNNEDEDQQFTESELKEYGLDDDMYEKVEVQE